MEGSWEEGEGAIAPLDVGVRGIDDHWSGRDGILRQLIVTRGLVLSDLHLLAPRSEGERLVEEWNDSLCSAEVLVLNGDTFDFRWSRLGCEQRSIAAAIGWVEDLLGRFGGRELHYLAGNHDCLVPFRSRLDDLVRVHPVLRCHDLHLRMGRALFLHGDCANRKMTESGLQRSREGWSRDRPRGRTRAALYQAIDALGVTETFHRWYFPPERTSARVAHYLDDALPAWRNEIDDCYLGHTHVPFRDHLHEGVRFHNTGSGIRGMGFQPLAFETESEKPSKRKDPN